MSQVERDPAGLLERIPELGPLAEAHPTLRRAIEHGRPHAAYRALFWLRLSGKTKRSAKQISDLLARRRLFLQPLTGAPKMFTMNGVGSTIYGESELDVQDGSHIKTLFLVLVFVPVYPFAAYLVQRSSAGNNRWNFFGKVPLSTPLYLWQRALALAGVLAVSIGALRAVSAMRYNTVRIANALPNAVDVRVGSLAPVRVASGELQSVRSKVGPQPVEVRAGGRVLESGTLDVRRGYDVVAWNVLGAGVLFNSRVAYTAKGSTPQEPEKPTFFCGERSVLLDDINYVFEKPPAELSLDEHQTVSYRSHVDFLKTSPFACVSELLQSGKKEAAGGLARQLAAQSDYALDTMLPAANFVKLAVSVDAACVLAEEALKHHEQSVEHHRLYQNYLLLADREAALNIYRAYREAHPDSADAFYLLGRLLHGDEARRFNQSALTRFPNHPYLIRSAAYDAMRAQDPASVVRFVDSLRPLDRKLWQDSVSLELQALAAQGSIDQARALSRELLASAGLDPSDRFEGVVDALRLARIEPRADETELLNQLHDGDADETQELRLHARISAACDVSPDEIAKLANERSRPGFELALGVRSDPEGCLRRVAQPGASLGRLSTASFTLLLSEAARLDPKHPALARLIDDFPYGRRLALALAHYAQTGESSAGLEDTEGDIRAAAHFVRARVPSLKSEERQALLAQAQREDVLRAVVSAAMSEWPK